MSDEMLLACLRAPISDERGVIEVFQLAHRARQAADTIEAQRAEIERLRKAVDELRDVADEDAPIYISDERRAELQRQISSSRGSALAALSGEGTK